MRTVVRILFLSMIVQCDAYFLIAQWVRTGGPNTGAVYAAAASGTTLFAGIYGNGVFRSSDNGATWGPVNGGLTNSLVRALGFCTTGLVAGTDGGVFLADSNGANWRGVSLGPATVVLSLVFRGTSLFAGTTQGVFLSTNTGLTWSPVNNGLTSTSVFGLAVNGTNLFAGTGGGVFLSTNDGGNWNAVNNGLTNINVRVVLATAGGVFAATNGGLFLTTNNGASWGPANHGLEFASVYSLAATPNLSGGTTLVAGTYGAGVYRSTDNGTQWTFDGMLQTLVRALAVGNSYVFAGTVGDTLGDAIWRRAMPQVIPVSMTQQGPKLFGTGAVGTAKQGASVALDANGSTALVGGHEDNSHMGAVWVYTRDSFGTWTQQGPKLVGTGAVGNASQGMAVSLSADGNTALVGAPSDNNTAGAAWVFTRTAGVWSQQGSKLVASGAIGSASFGLSVRLAGDGNTAVIGGPADNGNVGAAWIFVRSGGTWTQQQKLTGSGATGNARQGAAVSISGLGTTVMIGGPSDNTQTGAVWSFVFSGGVWTQQGSKLVGTGATGNAAQGFAVSLSGDGSTAMVGGPLDNNQTGAVWVFVQSGGVWSQQGPKLTGSDAAGNAYQGCSLLLSANGNDAVYGGLSDDTQRGAAWLFGRSGGVWTQQGGKLVGTGMVGNANQGSSVSMSADGTTAIVGGPNDNLLAGAAWVFYRPPGTFRAFLSRTNLNKPLLANQSTLDTITVSANNALATVVQDVNVGIDTIMYPNDGDLEMSLNHLGVNDTIVYRAGGSGSNFIRTLLDDSSAVPIANGTAPFTGRFSPSRPLAQFHGLDPTGSWILKVFDGATGHTGTLESWSLSIIVSTNPTSVPPADHDLPTSFRLMQNYPNPFNPSTTIRYSVPVTSYVRITVFDILGQEVAQLADGEMPAGIHQAVWNASGFPSGLYFYRLTVAAVTATRKMVLLK